MNKIAVAGVAAVMLPFSAAEIAGVPRDSNFGNTGGYDSTRVEAQLVVYVDQGTEKVHFIRDNNDPRVITKTYRLQNVDAYEFRDYLRQMVQSKRVGNATLQQSYPGNTTGSLPVATTGSPTLTNAQSQPGYTPPVQLGSNTAVECLKYVDGTGLLIVSAEEYRFKDHPNGIGIDTLVKMLDDPKLGALNYGSQMFLYLPKYVPARNLMPLIQNMGMNVSDVTELWQGQDLVAYDPDLNWLIFDVTNFNCDNIANMLKRYDVPIPQVRLSIAVYEIDRENDRQMGIDFQNWKNNEGADFFSAGGRYRNNWSALYSPGMPDPSYGSERTQFYNFNPKWNSRYLDFLASCGKARVAHTGTLLIRNGCGASLKRLTCLMYSDTSRNVAGATDPGESSGVGPYKLLSEIIHYLSPTGDDVEVGKGKAQITAISDSQFGFTMEIASVSVNLEETRFDVTLANRSLLGFRSDGAPRLSAGSAVTQTVSLPHGKDSFVIGGLAKEEIVKSRTGIPVLMDIPYLGYLFSTESSSVKRTELVVVGNCVWDSPADKSLTGAGKPHKR